MPLSLLRNVTFTTSSSETVPPGGGDTMFSTSVYYELSSSDPTASSSGVTTTASMYNTSDSFVSGHNTTGDVEGVAMITMSPQDALERALISWDDATWILTSSFIIFTMQSGFGLLEAGCVSAKNEVNIMVKNAVDVIFGGFAYWLFGYGLSFGDGQYSNSFVGWGDFLVDTNDQNDAGLVFSNFIFQLSFATTATTIVSGAMAERTKLSAYVAFSFVNTIVYCIPAHWIWTSQGFLNKLGCVDIAGSGGVHLVGGTSALVATIMLKPRHGRFDKGSQIPKMGNPTNAMVGMFMLWWGWLGFNCGSTFGISYGKWKLAAKAAVLTMCTSMGGGMVGVFFKSSVTTINGSIGGGLLGLVFSYWWRKRVYSVADLVNSVLGSLVSITAGCAVIRPWEALVIGSIGGIIVILATDLLQLLKVDDPVGASATHAFAGVWGLLAVGLFVEDEPVMKLNNGQIGLFKGGGPYSLGIQALAAVAIASWSALTTVLLLLIIKYTIGLRLSEFEERMGSDFVEHGIKRQCSCPEITVEEDVNKLENGHTNGHNRLSGCSLRRRSSFGFTRDTSDVIVPNGLLEGTPTSNGNHRHGNGHVACYENEALELPTVEEGIGESDNTNSTLNYI